MVCLILCVLIPNATASEFCTTTEFVTLFFSQINVDHDTSYLRTSRHYQAIMDSKIIADAPERHQMMTFACLYCILAPYDNEQQDMMLKLDKLKQLDESRICKDLLRLFMCKELIDFGAMEANYGKELLSFEIFDQNTAHGKKCWTELKNRVIEHVRMPVTVNGADVFLTKQYILFSITHTEYSRHIKLLYAHQLESPVRAAQITRRPDRRVPVDVSQQQCIDCENRSSIWHHPFHNEEGHVRCAQRMGIRH